MRTLAVKASNDSNTGEERFYIANEIDQLFYEFNAIVGEEPDNPESDDIEYGLRSGRAEFNTRALFSTNGAFPDADVDGPMEGLQFQIGANINQTLVLARSNDDTTELLTKLRALAVDGDGSDVFNGVLSELLLWEAPNDGDKGMWVASEEDYLFNTLIEEMDAAVGIVNSLRATLGAYQNRLEYTVRNLNSITENTIIAESRIRDTDMVDEMATFTRNNILLQSGTAMMAQANAKPQTVLRLLG